MARYIDADVLTEELYNMADDVDKDFGLLDRNSQYMMERGIRISAQYIINLAPTADVEEVKHGHWVQPNPYCKPFCSICSTFEQSGKKKNYCSECGAKMDEKDGE